MKHTPTVSHVRSFWSSTLLCQVKVHLVMSMTVPEMRLRYAHTHTLSLSCYNIVVCGMQALLSWLLSGPLSTRDLTEDSYALGTNLVFMT